MTDAVTRDKKGRWLPGRSANPKGKPPDSGMVGTLRKAIRERLPSIVAKLADQAEAGDVQAARVLVERVLPPVRAESREIVVEVLADDLTARAKGLIDAALAGKIPPNVAAELIQAIGATAKVAELVEFEQRLRRLEETRS
jgi:hypothetical protein